MQVLIVSFIPIMNFSIVAAVLVLSAVTLISAQRVSYEGYKVYHLIPNTESDVEYLISLEKSGVNFWKFCSVPKRPCDVLLSREQQREILKTLEEKEIAFTVFVDQVQSLIDSQVSENVGKPGKIALDQYNRVDEINAFLMEEAIKHDGVASVKSIGQSTQGRDLNVIKIAKTSTKKPIIFVEANAHAREWITSSVAINLIEDLLHSEDPVIQKWTEDFDWYVLPVFNPDGLEYSHTTDRMWRKNLANSTGRCNGVDLNRNFDYNWGGPGASHDPCQMTYCGVSFNSEPETKALTEFVENLGSDLVFYLSVHSYSQFIMFPFADKVDNTFYHSYMKVTSDAAKAAGERFGTKFISGNWMEMLYVSTGDSMDWAKSKLNVTLSLTYEMRDTGSYGFILPANQIIPSSLEFVDSLKPIIDALRNGSI